MKRTVTLFFLLLSLLHLNANSECSSCKTLTFKENKGQWEQNILYKTEMKNGAVFFENNIITFNLFDTRDIQRIKGDHHKLENYKPTIDYSMNFHAFKMKFENANVQSISSGNDPIEEYFNYFIGNNKSKWASKVRAFHQVDYNNLYKGIHLQVSSKANSLKYIYEAEKGVDVSQLKISFEGTNGLTLDEKGNLKIATSVGDVVDLKPYAYQIINGKEIEVPCKFALTGNSLTYNFPKSYNKQQKLFIDPTLIFSTYSGSTADNFGYSATYDTKGNAFAAGSVFGVGYPLVTGHYIMTYVGGSTITFTTNGTYPGDDIAITKYNTTGTQRIFSTYLGGYGQDLPHSLVANVNDELYMLGTTDCPDYPTKPDAYDTTYNLGNDPGVWDGIAAHYKRGSDIVVSRLSADGSQLLSSTYVGGRDNDGLNYRAGQSYATPGFLRHNYADEVRGEIDVDKSGNVYVASCTRSKDFPRTAGTFQNSFGGGMDACIFKMDATLSTMVWGTTFGGEEDDACYSVAIDGNENLFLAGGTLSDSFAVTNPVIQDTFSGGDADGFVIHLDKNGQVLIASTYYGYKDYDQIYFVELDRANNVYVYGQADSSASKYIKNALYNKPNGGQFISKFSENLDTIIWSTTFGRGLGITDISPTAFLADVCNHVYVCGWGSQGVNDIVGGKGGTLGLDTTAGAFKTVTDGQDFYLMVMNDDASGLVYATFMGGGISEEHVDGGTSRFDKKGVAYQSVCAGCGSNDDFPTTPGAVSRINGSTTNCNNAIFKFDLDLPACLADFTSPNACQNIPIQFSNRSSSVSSPTYQWFFGDGNSSTQPNPSHVYTQTGLFDVMLVIQDPGSCNFADTAIRKILVIGGSGTDTLPTLNTCYPQRVQIGIPPISDTAITYLWIPATNLSSPTVSNPFATPSVTTNYQLLVNNGACIDTFNQIVVVVQDSIIATGEDILCAGDTVALSVTSIVPGQALLYSWKPADLIISGANTSTPLVHPFQNTTYTVTGISSLGCIYTDSVTVRILSANLGLNAFANPDTILFGDTSQLGVQFTGVIPSLHWQPDSTLSSYEIPDPLAFPKETHTYYVEATGSDGCWFGDSVTVFILHAPCLEANLFIPNAFSPNNDGKNDILYVRGNGITRLYFAVYDRWGQKMFETKDMGKGWDGNFKGKKIDPAVFGYYLEGDCEGGEKFFKKGNVTLLR